MGNGASPSGKAQGFGPCIRRFESSRPSQNKSRIRYSTIPIYMELLRPFLMVLKSETITYKLR